MKLAFLKKYQSAKTLKEILTLLTWQEIEFLAFIPIFLTLITPLLYLLINFFTMWMYSFIILDVTLIATVLALVVYLLCLGKISVESKKRKLHEYLPILFLGTLAALIFLSDSVNGWSEYALHGVIWREETSSSFMRYILVFFFCGTVIRTSELKKILFRAFLFSGMLIGIATLLHHYAFTIEPLIHYPDYYINAVFLNPNHYGYYLTMLIMASAGLAVWEKKRGWTLFYWISFLLNTFMLAINLTFGSFLACLFALIFQIIMLFIMQKQINKKAVLLWVGYIAVNLTAAFFFDTVLSDFYLLFRDIQNIAEKNEDASKAGSGRWRLWKYTIQKIQEKPLLGSGTEGIADFLTESAKNTRTHNEYLQYMAFYGIPAGICYIAGILSLFLRALKRKSCLDGYTTAALVTVFGYCVSAFFGNTMFYTAPLFFCILGLTYRIPEQKV
ncbi:MAG: O-antigen ligase family protein [Oscillospiraceae bacterium]|nr:O-antigen ligase family protein [Oscillospiraceae bacterium]